MLCAATSRFATNTMRTITKNLFTFDELSKEAQDYAIREEQQSEGCLSYDWWDCTYDVFKEDMKSHGIAVDQMYFSGFWSQGDGACFTGTIELTEKELLGNLRDDLGEQLVTFNTKAALLGYEPMAISYTAEIKVSHQYSHSHSMHITSYDNLCLSELEAEHDSEIQREADALRDKILDETIVMDDFAIEIARNHADNLYRMLKQEYEYLTSDEVVADHLRLNEYEFDEEGVFVR